jgi:hypothetical protein
LGGKKGVFAKFLQPLGQYLVEGEHVTYEKLFTKPFLEVLEFMSSSICEGSFASLQQHGGGMRTSFSSYNPKNLLRIGTLEKANAAYFKAG